jgi:hypothetical protein
VSYAKSSGQNIQGIAKDDSGVAIRTDIRRRSDRHWNGSVQRPSSRAVVEFNLTAQDTDIAAVPKLRNRNDAVSDSETKHVIVWLEYMRSTPTVVVAIAVPPGMAETWNVLELNPAAMIVVVSNNNGEGRI